MAELFRHFVDDGVDPFEVRRRVGRVSVDLHVLDLTDKATRSHLGVDEADLVSDDCATTQTIAAPLAMRGLTPYLLRQRRYPAAKRSRCSFRRCPTSRPSGRRFASPLHGWLTFSR